jgi:type IV secretory pathway VirB10-like protein
MEQALNSDLPGELKALVTANVYDTATGRYLLIPQGARLIGTYDSSVAYGQDGLQVVWNRIIYPDAESIDLGSMEGADQGGYPRELLQHPASPGAQPARPWAFLLAGLLLLSTVLATRAFRAYQHSI